MRFFLWTVLVVLLPDGVPAARAAEEPRALLERALKARGGVEPVKKRVAVRMKVKGKFQYPDGVADNVRVEGEMWEFSPRGRIDLQMGLGEPKLRFTIVLDKDKSWCGVNGQVQNFDKDGLASLRISEYVDRVTELADLLTDKSFTLAPLADARVEGRPARGLKVSCKDRPDVSLYFDKETSLLVKYSYRSLKASAGKEVLRETVLSDYREPDLASADEKLVREAKSDVRGPALLAFLRQRTPTPANLDRARGLISKLGDDAFEVREQASRDLIALGAIAIPFLREATKNDDREIVRRVRECLQAIGEERSKAQTAAAIRLLGLRKPAGTAEALLNYLPSADAALAKELQAVLYAVAQAKREPDPVLLRALDDKDSLRRRAAAAALGKDGGAYARQPGRRLFTSMPKRPTKHKTWVDGKLDMEMESFDYQFFNAFEDKVFAKP
jgi:hypothetical protein